MGIPAKNPTEVSLLRHAGEKPWASVQDMAGWLGADHQTVRRLCYRLLEDGYLGGVSAGMNEPPRLRLWLTGKGANRAYVTADHVHPTSDEWERFMEASAARDIQYLAEFQIRYPDLIRNLHLHSPWRELANPDHVPWTAGYSGAARVLWRLPMAAKIYPILPDLFTSGMVVPEPPEEPGAMPKLARFNWLRSSRLYHAVATYDKEYWIAFTFVGVSMTAPALREKVAYRFADLDRYPPRKFGSLAVYGEHAPSESEIEPAPSLHVVVGADRWAEHLGVSVLREAMDGNMICGFDELQQGGGVCSPSTAFLADPWRHVEIETSENESLALVSRINRATGPGAITNSASFNLLIAAYEFPGSMQGELADIVGASRGAVKVHLNRMAADGILLCDHNEYFVDRPGITLLARLSRTSAGQVLGPYRRYLDAGGRAKERRHNRAVSAFVALCARAGAKPHAGHRAVINIPGVTQVVPDAVVYLHDGPGGTGWYSVEVELTAKYPSQVRRKLLPYRILAEAGQDVRLLVITEKESAAAHFANLGTGLPMAVTTFERAKAGLGGGGLWLSAGGAPVSVRLGGP